MPKRDPNARVRFLEANTPKVGGVVVPPAPPEADRAIRERSARSQQAANTSPQPEEPAMGQAATPEGQIASGELLPAAAENAAPAEPVGQDEPQAQLEPQSADEEEVAGEVVSEQSPAPDGQVAAEVAQSEPVSPAAPTESGKQNEMEPAVESAPAKTEPAAPAPASQPTEGIEAAKKGGRQRIYTEPAAKVMIRVHNDMYAEVLDRTTERRKSGDRQASANAIYLDWLMVGRALADEPDALALIETIREIAQAPDKNAAAQIARRFWHARHPESDSTAS